MSKPLHIGQIVRVFDDRAWRRVGHDIGDNSRFYKAARIERLYDYRGSDPVADVTFLAENRLSKAHFVWGIKA